MVLAALSLVFINAFFVTAEFSLVKVRRTRLDELAELGNKRAELALKILDSFDSHLGATRLGTTLATLALGWIGEPAVASLIEPYIGNWSNNINIISGPISVIIGFTIITFLHVVIGELVPKSLAIQKAEKLVLIIVWPLYIFHKIGYPLVVLFNFVAKMILKFFGVTPSKEVEVAHSEDELRMIVSASHRGGVINQVESEIIDNVFDFADRLAREVMVPRQDMICLFVEDSFEDNIKIVRKTGHTRYPICFEDKDHVIGMVHIRDLMDMDKQNKDLRSVMREILVVPEGMSVANVLQFMKRKRTHLAVVADEYGGTAGLVALEDVIEEIVGDIQDEHDNENIEIEHLQDGCFEFDGKVLIDEVAEILNISLDGYDEDTIGGLIFGKLGRRPEIGDKAIFGDYEFKITQVAGYRIVRVLVTKINTEVEDAN